MRRTQSEHLFEQFCETKRIRFKRVTVGATRTPDYDVFLPTRKVVIEVKEITPNAEEKAAAAAARNRQYVVVSLTPGERVRRKIADASAQIKARTRSRYPGVLVLYEDGPLPRHVDHYQVRVAMYGLETIVFAVPQDPRASPYPVARRYGPRRKLTPTDNRSISAVAVLSSPHRGPVELTVFHNAHATVPLPPSLLCRYGIRQYQLANAQQDSIANWEEVGIGEAAP